MPSSAPEVVIDSHGKQRKKKFMKHDEIDDDGEYEEPTNIQLIED